MPWRLTAGDREGTLRRLGAQVGGGRLDFFQRRDESVSPPVYRGDHTLTRARVTHRAPHRGNAAGKHRVADGFAGPELIEKLLLGDDAIEMLDQMEQYVEDLGLELHDLAASPQIETARIDHTIAEGAQHAQFTAFRRFDPEAKTR